MQPLSTVLAGCRTVYAYGLVMWELLTHELPFEGENHFQVGPRMLFKQYSYARSSSANS